MSPYEEKSSELPSDLNNKNITKILGAGESQDDTVRIFLCGDSQRSYDELDAMVNKANSISGVDFIVMAGDITDFGLEQEFQWVYDRLEKLHKPYICVIGNHDYVSNGEELYERVFGAKNFSFVFKNYKFLFHDTNGREHNFNGTAPNIGWLSNELNDKRNLHYAAFSHIPPFDVDFDKNLENPYKDLFASTDSFTVSAHGHLHGNHDSYFYNDHVRYIVTNSIGHREAVLLKLCRSSVIKEIISF